MKSLDHSRTFTLIIFGFLLLVSMVLLVNLSQRGQPLISNDLKVNVQKTKSETYNDNARENEISDFRTLVEDAMKRGKEEIYDAIKTNPNMVILLVTWMLKDSIEQEFAGDHKSSSDLRKGAETVATIAYERLGNKKGLKALEDYYKWTRHDKQILITAKRLFNQGSDLVKRQRLVDALEKFAQAKKLYNKVGDHIGEIGAVQNMGSAYMKLYEYSKALECFKTAAEISSQLGDNHSLIYLLINISDYEYLAGQYSSAMLTAKKALELAKNDGDRTYLAFILRRIGYVYQMLGHYEEAVRSYTEALDTTHNNRLISDMYYGMAETEYSLKNYAKAQNILDEILRKADKKVAARSIANALALQGNCYLRIGEYAKALTCFNEGLELARKIKQKSPEMNALLGMGQTYAAMGKYQPALNCYQRILRDKVWYPYAKTPVLWEVGSVHEKQGESEKAKNYYKKAIRQVEDVRNQIHSPLLNVNYFEAYGEPYNRMINILADSGKYKEALYYKERAKARALLDSLFKNNLEPLHISKDLMKRKSQIQAEITFLQRALIDHYIDPHKHTNVKLGLENKLNQAKREYQDILEMIQLQSNRPAQLRMSEKSLISDLQKKVISKESVVIEYHVGETNTFAWIVRHDDLDFKKLKVGRSDLLNKINALRQPIEDYKHGRIESAHLQFNFQVALELYEALFKPLEESLEGKSRIIIIPDDVLFYLPFDCLVTNLRPARFLLERYTLSYSPSANILRHLSRKRSVLKPKLYPLLALGAPLRKAGPVNDDHNLTLRSISNWTFNPLPKAEQEIREISSYFKSSKALINEEATEYNFKRFAPDSSIIHMATHAVSDDKEPLFSTIVLSTGTGEKPNEDGLLQAHEIAELNLGAELVVLSACDTGLGRLSKGEGVIGLVNSFLQAGAKSMIVSLWSVADDSTALLMKHFYQYFTSGHGKAKSLRLAKLKLIRESENSSTKQYNRNPLLWGAFALIGDLE